MAKHKKSWTFSAFTRSRRVHGAFTFKNIDDLRNVEKCEHVNSENAISLLVKRSKKIERIDTRARLSHVHAPQRACPLGMDMRWMQPETMPQQPRRWSCGRRTRRCAGSIPTAMTKRTRGGGRTNGERTARHARRTEHGAGGAHGGIAGRASAPCGMGR